MSPSSFILWKQSATSPTPSTARSSDRSLSSKQRHLDAAEPLARQQVDPRRRAKQGVAPPAVDDEAKTSPILLLHKE
jgi:hypothetical protein